LYYFCQTFTLEVVREKATYGLQKVFDDFFNFHTGLIFQFPEEAGRRSQKRTLPDLPCQTVFVSDSIAAQRRMELDRYMKKLFQLPEKITASSYVTKFLEPKDGAGSSSGGAPPRASTTFQSSSTSFQSASANPARSSATYTPPGSAAVKPYREKTLPRPKPQAPAPRQMPPKVPASRNPALRTSKS